MKKRLFAGILAVASCLPLALPAAESEISIHDPYVRLAPPGIRTTAGFMLIRNAGAEDRRLLKAESPAAGVVELHSHINDNGVMRMREVAGIAIPAHGQTELKPGGYHIMLMGLRDPLVDGRIASFTLTFEKAGPISVHAAIKQPPVVDSEE